MVGVNDNVEEKGHGGSGRVECDKSMIISIPFLSEFARLINVEQLKRTSMNPVLSSS